MQTVTEATPQQISSALFSLKADLEKELRNANSEITSLKAEIKALKTRIEALESE
mgnify:FL=1